MKNRFICIILLWGLFSAQFSQYFIVAGFDLNQKYIAAQLCVNKSRPWMHCNGHCYLMKKLKQAADKEKSAERENQKNSFQVAIITQPDHFSLKEQHSRTLVVREAPFALPKNQSSIFQPPRA
ncbi:hypothetical protein [Mucilaginibacter polytrichastri]|uniref:Uncharacterized protein n=1 Tax=Mucilaginibacter polytrichastri TaxID=1302689 RepID=A0A1Q5ZUX5_9SPHI|nr:hypothetical protein [Mucilaginibacter polytrichastri]OKS85582.1 hypothetical protein RG47T_1028 [Mucilaginibacter polytrichastri]SFS36198.1 hypothetical protein SAMN04487890_10172 [Mucilaginibacter polytrichastri]